MLLYCADVKMYGGQYAVEGLPTDTCAHATTVQDVYMINYRSEAHLIGEYYNVQQKRQNDKWHSGRVLRIPRSTLRMQNHRPSWTQLLERAMPAPLPAPGNLK